MGGGDQHGSGRGVHSPARPLLAAAAHSRPPASSGFNRRPPGDHDRPPAGSGFNRRARGAMTGHPQAAGRPGGLRLLLACGCQMVPVWECAVLKGELAASSTGPAWGCAGPGWVAVISTGPVGECTPLQDPCWLPRPTRGHPQAAGSPGGPRGAMIGHQQAAGSPGGPRGGYDRPLAGSMFNRRPPAGDHDKPPAGSGLNMRTRGGMTGHSQAVGSQARPRGA